jgi:hypothetical protein
MNEPTRINSWDEYVEIFGNSTEFYLTPSVEAFFRNGGLTCFVVRVAHMAGPDEKPSVDHASCAERLILDDWNKPSLRVRALNEGVWGNNIWVSMEHSTGAKALLTQDLEIGAGEARVSSTRGFEVGQLVRIHDRENSDFVVLTEIGERTVRWSAETPVNRHHKAASPTHLEVMAFDIHVALRDRREVFKGLQLHPSSKRYAPRVVSEESRLVALEDLGTSSPPPHNLPEPEPATRLGAGRDGTGLLTPEDFVGHDHGPADRAGIMALGAVDEVATLVCPDAMVFMDRDPGPGGESKTQRIQDVMVSQAESLQDRMAVLDCPRIRSIDAVKRWRRRIDSSYAAFYWPWIGVAGLRGNALIPPSGIMAGVFARTDSSSGAHQSPANVPLSGAIDVSVRVTEDDLGALTVEGINCFRISRGIRPWGARTASSDPDWRYINVRRIFIMLRRSISIGMAWVPFEPNNHTTWQSLKNSVHTFLGDLHQKGMFAAGKPEDSFFVRCGEDTNPPEAVDAGLLTVEIGVAPAIPAEFIMISVVERMDSEE